MSYRDLDIWKLARELTIEIRLMTINHLPKFEMYETGSQLRRSMKSVRANIVEGYGRRRYIADYIKHLIYAQASNDESIDHLETLFETRSLEDEQLYHELHKKINQLGKMLNKFIQSIEKYNHQQPISSNKRQGTSHQRQETSNQKPATRSH